MKKVLLLVMIFIASSSFVFAQSSGISLSMNLTPSTSILDKVSLRDLPEITSLVLSGYLDPKELELICSRCVNLEVLNLRNTTGTLELNGASFYYLDKLRELYLPNKLPITVKIVGADSLVKIDLPSNMTKLARLVIERCGQLKELNIPPLKKFCIVINNCASFESIKFNGPVDYKVEGGTFSVSRHGEMDVWISDCPNVKQIRIPEGVSIANHYLESSRPDIHYYFPSTISFIMENPGPNNAGYPKYSHLHFKTVVAPLCINYEYKYTNAEPFLPEDHITIHYPKGHFGTYYHLFGDSVHYVEE